MPIPSRRDGEEKAAFMSRCMSDSTMTREYPTSEQRTAVCMSKACEGSDHIAAMDFQMYFNDYGSEEELSEDNFYIPSEEEYVSAEEVFHEDSEIEEWDISTAKPGLWDNIRKKKMKEGKNYRPAKPGDPDRPDPESWKKAQSAWRKIYASSYEDDQMQREQIMKMHQQLMEIEQQLSGVSFEDWTKDMISKSEIYIQNIYDFVKFYEKDEREDSEAQYKYMDPETGEVYTYSRPGVYKKDGRNLVRVRAAEYQGRKVKLGKPFRTPSGPKKFSVYVKNDKGNVVKVNFGDPQRSIKRDNPERRKSFRARHNCSDPGPRWKARYWSCRQWRASTPVED